MVRWTSPTISLHLKSNVSGAQLYVTLSQRGGISVTKDVCPDEISIRDGRITDFEIKLDQEDTARLNPGDSLMVQANWVYPDGTRGASRVMRLPITDNLYRRFLRYEPAEEE